MARHQLSLDAAARALGISRRMLAYCRTGEKSVPRTVGLAGLGWEVEQQAAAWEAERQASWPASEGSRIRPHPQMVVIGAGQHHGLGCFAQTSTPRVDEQLRAPRAIGAARRSC